MKPFLLSAALSALFRLLWLDAAEVDLHHTQACQVTRWFFGIDFDPMRQIVIFDQASCQAPSHK